MILNSVDAGWKGTYRVNTASNIWMEKLCEIKYKIITTMRKLTKKKKNKTHRYSCKGATTLNQRTAMKNVSDKIKKSQQSNNFAPPIAIFASGISHTLGWERLGCCKLP